MTQPEDLTLVLEDPSLAERFIESVTDWQRRLLQLDRRNNLLYFRPGRSAVRIIDETPDDLLKLVTSSRHGVKFDYAERRGSPQDHFDFEDNDAEPDILLIPGDVKTDCPPLDLQRRLRTLRRRDREWEQEQGLNVLYLALGFLEWVDEDGERTTAPLLMLPCDLERESPRDVFRLKQDDEDLTANLTLAVKLKEFDIELLEPEETIERVSEYLENVRRLIAKRPDWRVLDDVYLATFAYSKLAMWRDLEIIKNGGTDHSIVLTLAGTQPSTSPDETPTARPPEIPADLSGGRLDDVLDVRDQFAVLPTDYSQLLAITAARSGSNLVIHGPPGTGKSQTIANIIATFMAEGKTVLFVSEKTAALDVVKRRLDEKQLGVFCLDLHSERGSKTSVYRQLQESVNSRRNIQKLDFDYATLAERRGQLNRVVRALHKVREPMGVTVFQVNGRFASLRDVPHVSFEVKDVGTIDQARLAYILEAANRVSLRHREFNEHWTGHWRVLKGGTPSLELANAIRQDMKITTSAVESLQSNAPDLAKTLGLRNPDNLVGVGKLEAVARHLGKGPGVLRTWLEDGASSRLRISAEQEAELQRKRAQLLKTLGNAFGYPIPGWDFGAISERLVVTPAEEQSLKSLLGGEWAKHLLEGQRATTSVLSQVKDALARLNSESQDVERFLSVETAGTLPELRKLHKNLQTLGRVAPIPPRWAESGGIDTARAAVANVSKVAQQLDELESRIFSEYEVGIVEAIGQEMLIRYRTIHQSRLRRLISPSYRSDRRTMQAFCQRPGQMSFHGELATVENVIEVKRLNTGWLDLKVEVEPVLGNRYRGRTTKWDSVRKDISEVEGLIKDWAGELSPIVRLLAEPNSAAHSQELAQKLGQALSSFEGCVNSSLDTKLAEELRVGLVTLASIGQLFKDSTFVVERIETVVAEPVTRALETIAGLEGLRDLMLSGAELRSLESEHGEVDEAHQLGFGTRYKGFDTDWPDILACLSWVDDLLQMVGSDGLTSTLLSHVEEPSTFSRFEQVADVAANALRTFRTETEPLRATYDLDAGPWGKWEDAKFDDILQWAQTLSDDADSASDWLSYTAAVTELDQSFNWIRLPSITQLIRLETDDSELVPLIVERRVLSAWLDDVYRQEPLLSSFASLEQDDLIRRFKELDQQLALAAQMEVRKRVFERYPYIHATSSEAGQLGMLRGELSKRRKRWPVRRLIRTMPHLIQKLKPCFLVSPLAVSQYLPLATMPFDVVVFDEASQVFPENAIPAILRGRKLILAGDQKQLPPSNFWRRSLAEDESDYDEESDEATSHQLVGRESILDVGVGLVGSLFVDSHLNVHYRSRDEELIRFSNHYFYDDGLLTFPSPGETDRWQGVYDVYVPEGRFDAGATRTNRIEAEQVVSIVFEHMRTRPLGESLGVVALSRSQADLIERLIDERRLQERDVDERFTEDTDEPFFVKNLENVQGDERDHIVISVGYGPTVGSGAVPNRFGPINVEGGERRLNVMVTRAKQRVDVVHSLRPNDIRSQNAGPRLLRRYLEYALNPSQAIEAQVTVDSGSEPESPFEDAVYRALIRKGYRVDRQVGVTGYRIDLAILSEDGSRHDLGLECDGWTYHSAPAARDRDWLRQQVLEGLGWKIHRIWSTAWVRNPKAELDRIETALAAARSESKILIGKSTTSKTTLESENGETNGPPGPPLVEVLPRESEDLTLEEYQRVRLTPPPLWAELRYETKQNLFALITDVARTEGPVHHEVVLERIRRRYRLGHLKGASRKNVEWAIREARREKEVKSNGEFIWYTDEQLHRSPRRPVDKDINHMAPTELGAVVVAVVKSSFGISRSDLVVEASRKLGFARTGEQITKVLDSVIEQLLQEGKLVDSSGMINISD